MKRERESTENQTPNKTPKLGDHELIDEIIEIIFSFLPLTDLLSCALASKHWKYLSQKKHVWKNIILKVCLPKYGYVKEIKRVRNWFYFNLVPKIHIQFESNLSIKDVYKMANEKECILESKNELLDLIYNEDDHKYSFDSEVLAINCVVGPYCYFKYIKFQTTIDIKPRDFFVERILNSNAQHVELEMKCLEESVLGTEPHNDFHIKVIPTEITITGTTKIQSSIHNFVKYVLIKGNSGTDIYFKNQTFKNKENSPK
jgi:hypothetical protein